MSEQVELSIEGDFETLELHIDQYTVDSGEGPELVVVWDSTVVVNGVHTFHAVGITSSGNIVESEQDLEVLNP